MAAAHSNKSPSPLCSRPSANPNPRNSENNLGVRRSFSSKPSALTNQRRFDPTTPANSPSDFGGRRFVNEEKENEERELKASKLQSPAAKGSKNFMAPTISAASKFTPSPRKKVLVERNDPVRTSISLSDGKAIFFSNSPNVSEDFDSKLEKEIQKSDRIVDTKAEKAPVSKSLKRVSFSDLPSAFSYHESESMITDHESESVITDSVSAVSNNLNFEPSLNPNEAISSTPVAASIDSDNSKFELNLKNETVSSTPIAPLDADPSLPPYDPKTNYLSPRPQFLHYKPNPKIEILLNKEKGFDLEEESMSENLSETSEGTEESQAENAPNEELEEMVVSAPADMVIGMDELEADPPSETLPVSTPVIDAVSEAHFVQRNGTKSRALFRLVCFSTLVALLIGCVSISVTHSERFNEFVIKDLSLSDATNFFEQSKAVVSSSTKANFNRIGKHVNQFSVSSVSWVSKLANELGNGGKQAPLQFMNLSELQGDAWNKGHFLQNDASMEFVEDLEEEYEVEEEWNVDQLEEEVADEREAYAEIDSDEREMPIESEEVAELEQEIYDVPQDQESNLESASEVAGINAESEEPDSFTPGSSGDQETNLVSATEVAEISVESEKPHVDISTSGNSVDQSAATNLEEAAIEDAEANIETEESHVEDAIQSPSEYNSFAQKAMGASSLFAAVLAVAALYHHCKKRPGSAHVIQPDPPLLNKETGLGFASTKQVPKVNESSQNWQTEDDDHHGEPSCPSEMSSSFQKSASYSKNANEVESSEMKKMRKLPKRESLASSSSELSMGGSPSYGSFTTFERIPIKHANGEEEIVTPVRRSSRIRKHQFTSP